MAKKKVAPKGKEKSVDDKAAKKAERMEKLKNRPEGQRANSKQVDIIETENGTIETYAYPVRKTGSLVTTVAKDSEGNVVSTSTTFIPGVKAKAKKGHGTIVPGVAGEGKKGKKGSDEDEDDDDNDGEDTPAEAPAKKDKKAGKKKSKKND